MQRRRDLVTDVLAVRVPPSLAEFMEAGQGLNLHGIQAGAVPINLLQQGDDLRVGQRGDHPQGFAHTRTLNPPTDNFGAPRRHPRMSESSSITGQGNQEWSSTYRSVGRDVEAALIALSARRGGGELCGQA